MLKASHVSAIDCHVYSLTGIRVRFSTTLPQPYWTHFSSQETCAKLHEGDSAIHVSRKLPDHKNTPSLPSLSLLPCRSRSQPPHARKAKCRSKKPGKENKSRVFATSQLVETDNNNLRWTRFLELVFTQEAPNARKRWKTSLGKCTTSCAVLSKQSCCSTSGTTRNNNNRAESCGCASLQHLSKIFQHCGALCPQRLQALFNLSPKPALYLGGPLGTDSHLKLFEIGKLFLNFQP